MSVVALKIADYTYKIACQDGQEKHIAALSSYLDEKAKKLLASVGGYIPENQLLAMVSVLTAQELFTAKSQAQEAALPDPQTLEIIDSLCLRMTELADLLKKE